MNCVQNNTSIPSVLFNNLVKNMYVASSSSVFPMENLTAQTTAQNVL